MYDIYKASTDTLNVSPVRGFTFALDKESGMLSAYYLGELVMAGPPTGVRLALFRRGGLADELTAPRG